MEHPLNQFKYCPKCGSAAFEIHNEKSKQCTDCGFVYYFNPSSGSRRGDRTKSEKGNLPVFPSEHLYLFRVSCTYARHVFPLPSGRYKSL